MRKLAKQKGVSVLEFNTALTEAGDRVVDGMIDDETRRHAAENVGRDIVFDSRLAWFFVGESFKVFLTVSPKEAAERVFSGRVLEEESYVSKEDALKDLIVRRETEIRRFKDFYGVDCNDYKNYDLIIDTSKLATAEIADIIFSAYAEYNDSRYIKCYINPKNVYPSKGKKEAEPSGSGDGLVSLIKLKNEFFIYSGRESVKKAIKNGEKIIPARIRYYDCGALEDGITIDGLITARLNDVREWERENKFEYGYYPHIFT
jgi:cytidylate kinase